MRPRTRRLVAAVLIVIIVILMITAVSSNTARIGPPLYPLISP